MKAFPNAGYIFLKFANILVKFRSKKGANKMSFKELILDGLLERSTVNHCRKSLWLQMARSSLMLTSIVDHQISFYDSSTLSRVLFFDLECQNALSIDYFVLPDVSAKAMLFYCTDSGYCNVVTLDEQYLINTITRQNKNAALGIFIERDNLPLKHRAIGTVWKRKSHNDWALSIKYLPHLKMIVSCSADEINSLTLAQYGNDHQWHFKHASVTKGVLCFDYNPQIIATGKISFCNSKVGMIKLSESGLHCIELCVQQVL